LKAGGRNAGSRRPETDNEWTRDDVTIREIDEADFGVGRRRRPLRPADSLPRPHRTLAYGTGGVFGQQSQLRAELQARDAFELLRRVCDQESDVIKGRLNELTERFGLAAIGFARDTSASGQQTFHTLVGNIGSILAFS
jgi:hypothetical protein